MSDIVKEKQRMRIAYLNKVYELSCANTSSFVNGAEVAFQIGLKEGQEEEIEAITSYLEGEGLLKVNVRVRGFPLSVAITHTGIKEIEGAIGRPDQPTKHFMPINILHVETMIGSNIQQGVIGSHQKIKLTADVINELKYFIAELEDEQAVLNLSQDENAELKSDIATINAQISSPKPKNSILKECLHSLKRILEGAAGGAAGSIIVNKIPQLLAML